MLFIYFVSVNLFYFFGKICPSGFRLKLHHDFHLENQHKLLGFENCREVFQFVNGLLLYTRFLMYRCKYSKISKSSLDVGLRQLSLTFWALGNASTIVALTKQRS